MILVDGDIDLEVIILKISRGGDVVEDVMGMPNERMPSVIRYVYT